METDKLKQSARHWLIERAHESSYRPDGLWVSMDDALKLADYRDDELRALLAALERAERIERAAKARKFAADVFYALPAGTSPDQWGGAIGAMRGAEADLDAALKND